MVWLCPKITQAVYKPDDMIYIEGERITTFYSIIKGQAAYVLPEFNFC